MPESERTKSMQQVYDQVKNLRQPIRVSTDFRDIFIEKSKEHVGDDLFQEVRDAN
jgi:hypothetical protein